MLSIQDYRSYKFHGSVTKTSSQLDMQNFVSTKSDLLVTKTKTKQTRRFSNHVSRLLSRSHTFAIIVILDLKIHQSMWIHWPFFPKTWTKGHWPLDDLWPHVCWGHMCDSTPGSLSPSPMTIHQCMWIQSRDQFCKIPHTYIHILRTYYILRTYDTTYRMSDHIVSYWTQFRRDKNHTFSPKFKIQGLIISVTI